WFVYVVRFLGKSAGEVREQVRTSLREKGIASQIYFTPIHHQPFFQQCFPNAKLSLANTDLAAKQCLALPFHSRLKVSEIEFVCDSLTSALGATSRSSTVPGAKVPAPAIGI